MVHGHRPWLAALAAAVVLLAGSCGGGGDGSVGGGQAGGSSDLPACPLGAIDEAPTKPVVMTFWHSMTLANEETLVRLTDRFNTSQQDVRVELVNQTSYDDTLTKYKAALGGGTLPDLVQIQDVDQQLVIDSRSLLPAQSCIEADDDYDNDDVLARIRAYYTVDGVQWAMPFSVSNPVLYYNKKAFKAAGLNPEKPPATLDEVRSASEKLVASGAVSKGIALKIDPWYVEEWLAMGGNLFADSENGRDGRATKVLFDGEPGKEIFRWLAAMVGDGLAIATPTGGSLDNYLAVANGAAAMTFDTSAGLGRIMQVLGGGAFPNVELGVARLPGPEGDGGAVVAGSALYLVNKSSAAEQEAAWRFSSWLSEPEQTAEWHAGTGYIPIRESATGLPAVTELWAKSPWFRVAYDQIASGSESPASAGAVIGDFEGVRRAIVAAEEAIFRTGADPDKALADAATEANRAIADYERRIGG